jgi:hypothetical protein
MILPELNSLQHLALSEPLTNYRFDGFRCDPCHYRPSKRGIRNEENYTKNVSRLLAICPEISNVIEKELRV